MNRHSVRSVFLSDQGIRVGWKVLIFIALYAVLRLGTAPLLGQIISISETEPNPPTHALIRESWSVLLVFVATWVMARIEGRSVFEFGYGGTGKLTLLLSGMAWGFVSLSLLVGCLWLKGSFTFDGQSLHGNAAWEYALAWGLMFVLVGIAEESLLRGYPQYALSRTLGFWWAALILCGAFVLLHAGIKGESPAGLVLVGGFGLVCCLSLWYTKSLFWAVGLHAGWDWGQSYLFGTANSGMLTRGHLLATHPTGNPLWSGGATGPEGSLLALAVPVLMGAAMWAWWGRGKVTSWKGSP